MSFPINERTTSGMTFADPYESDPYSAPSRRYEDVAVDPYEERTLYEGRPEERDERYAMQRSDYDVPDPYDDSRDQDFRYDDERRMYAKGDEALRDEPLYYRRVRDSEGFPEEGLGRMRSARSETTPTENVETAKPVSTKKKAFDDFLNDSHSGMSSKYVESKVTDDPKKLSMRPVRISASCVDEEIAKNAGVIKVNENKFARLQKSKFARSPECQKKLQSSSIAYFRGLTGLDFSMISNPNVEKERSSFVLKDEKSGKQLAKMSPYIMWDVGSAPDSPKLLVDNVRGFPSLEKSDQTIESGYMVTVKDEDGIRIHGNFGGKKGKVMLQGQSMYYGDALVYPSRAHRMPVWIRLASDRPSDLVGKNVSVAHMNAKMVPLRAGRKASDMTDFSGIAVRKLKIDEVAVGSSAATEPEEGSRVINASLEINFEE